MAFHEGQLDTLRSAPPTRVHAPEQSRTQVRGPGSRVVRQRLQGAKTPVRSSHTEGALRGQQRQEGLRFLLHERK